MICELVAQIFYKNRLIAQKGTLEKHSYNNHYLLELKYTI